MSAIPTETNATKVTGEVVRHIAALSNLRLTPSEEIAMERDLNAILNYVDQLKELDTSTTEPMSQVGELVPTFTANNQDSRTKLRLDEPVSSLERAAVMQSAPETDGIFFKVPKVLER